MSIFTPIISELKKIWTSWSGALRKAIPEAIVIVNWFKTFVNNPTVDAIVEALSNGVINTTTLALINKILADLLTGLADASQVASLTTPNEILAYLGSQFAKLTTTQQTAFLTQLATEIAKVTGESEGEVNAAITALVQAAFAEPTIIPAS